MYYKLDIFHIWFDVYIIFYLVTFGRLGKVNYKQMIGKLSANEGTITWR